MVGSAGHGGLLTFGPDGDLYVGLFLGNDIWHFDGTTGASQGSFIPTADPHPQTPWIFTFGPDGNLYVASSATDEVLRYDGTTAPSSTCSPPVAVSMSRRAWSSSRSPPARSSG